MRDIRKRILCALTAAVLLTGCASSGTSGSESTSQSEEKAISPEEVANARQTSFQLKDNMMYYITSLDAHGTPFDTKIKRIDINIKDGVWEVGFVKPTSDPATDKVKRGSSANGVREIDTTPDYLASFLADLYSDITTGSAVVFIKNGRVSAVAFTPDTSDGIPYTEMPQVTDGEFAMEYPWNPFMSEVTQSGMIVATAPSVGYGGELPTTDYRAANEVEDTGPDLETAKAGDVITYGEFEQDNDTSNGKEPIEWLVLENDNGRLTVISRYVLDYGKMNDVYSTSWDQCDVRTWLNKTFYNESFTEEERMHIAARKVSGYNPVFSQYVSGGELCRDNIFLLSMEDTADYFPNGHLTNSDYEYYLSDDLVATCTAYAAAKGTSMSSDSQYIELTAGDKCKWWLRSVGNANGYFSMVGDNGAVSPIGWAGNYGVMGIRPAMQLIADEDDAKLEATIDNAKAGDIITLGSYEQDNNTSNGKEPIEWEVFDVLDNGEGDLVLISKKILDTVPYHKYNEFVDWDESTIKTWLNDDFYYEAFSEKDRSIIEREESLPYYLMLPNASDIIDRYGGDLYLDDFYNYYYAPEMIAPCTEYSKAKGCVGRWWLDDAGFSNFGYSYLCLDENGYINDGMINADNIGVRPRLRLSR